MPQLSADIVAWVAGAAIVGFISVLFAIVKTFANKTLTRVEQKIDEHDREIPKKVDRKELDGLTHRLTSNLEEIKRETRDQAKQADERHIEIVKAIATLAAGEPRR